MYYRFTAIITAFLVLFIVHAVSAMDMKDGLWEITTKVEMPGMPMEMPATKSTQCLTSKDSVPQDKEQHDQDCKIKKIDIKGNTVTWEVDCISDGERVKGNGRVTYKGDTFEGETKMEMEGMNMTHKMKGRRIGNCK